MDTLNKSESRKPHNARWVIVTFKKSFLWMRHIAELEGESDETWMINPPRRYILNANQLKHVEQHIESISDLESSNYYRPLSGNVNLSGAKIVVERYRDRGIGDLLFLTGPFSYLQHLSGNSSHIYCYTLANRGYALYNNPTLHDKTALYGPLHYDDLPLYHYHWLLSTVTECNEEDGQLNVYDALYKSMGLDYRDIDPKYKRPSIFLDKQDGENLDSFYYYVFLNKKIDLRKTGYYVVAPLSHGSLRTANYSTWVHVIRDLAERRPVIVIGQMTDRMPSTDMSVAQFIEQVNKIHPSVVNMVGTTPLRVAMSIISNAVATICLDSAPLYISQACRIPAVSIWGTHHPGVRLGYDKDYMDTAIWMKDSCRYSPCYAYSGFPTHKCPMGSNQTVCEVLRGFDAKMVMDMIEVIEEKRKQKTEIYAPGAP